MNSHARNLMVATIAIITVHGFAAPKPANSDDNALTWLSADPAGKQVKVAFDPKSNPFAGAGRSNGDRVKGPSNADTTEDKVRAALIAGSGGLVYPTTSTGDDPQFIFQNHIFHVKDEIGTINGREMSPLISGYSVILTSVNESGIEVTFDASDMASFKKRLSERHGEGKAASAARSQSRSQDQEPTAKTITIAKEDLLNVDLPIADAH